MVAVSSRLVIGNMLRGASWAFIADAVQQLIGIGHADGLYLHSCTAFCPLNITQVYARRFRRIALVYHPGSESSSVQHEERVLGVCVDGTGKSK